MPDEPAIPGSAAAVGRMRTPSGALSTLLLDAADRVLVRDGPLGLTIRAVAREAGVAPMGVYNRFGSKQAMLVAVAVRAADDLRDEVDVPSGAGPSAAVERFAAACQSYRRFAISRPDHYRLLFSDGSPLHLGSAELLQRAQALLDVLIDLIRDIGNGEPAQHENNLQTAQHVWSAIHGAVLIETAQLSRTPDPSVTYTGLIDLLIRGLDATTY